MPPETPEERITRLRSWVLYRHQLLETGTNERMLRSLVSTGRFVRITRGAYLPADRWDGLTTEDRLLLTTIAHANLTAGRTPVFSHASAAAIWKLPLWRLDDTRAHVLTPVTSPSNRSTDVQRHHADLANTEICEVAGLWVTSIRQTILDLARYAKPELAIGVADAGIQAIFGSRHANNRAEVEEWRGSQLERLRPLRGARGVRQARKIIELADPRADSVAESVSRLQLARLRLEVEIQVPVRGSSGQNYWLDFEFIGQRAFGEVDGAVKYLDPEMRRGRTTAQIVLEEKRREDDIRGIEDKRVVRWMPDAIGRPETLGRLLRAFGLRVPGMD